jgi:hypothetical protein
MRYPYSNIYNQFVQQSPVPLQSKLSPKAFSKNGDQFIMVCDPSFPTIGNCHYYQTHSPLNKFQRKSMVEKAKSLGLSVIPALNIDLDSLSKYKCEKDVRIANFLIKIKVSPCGNVRVMDDNEQHRIWIKTGKDSPRVTMKAFEIEFFRGWTANVVYVPPKGAFFTLTKKGKHGEEIELKGAIKKSKHNDGFEASLYPVESEHIFQMGPFVIGGEFGFKIEVTGQWQLWEEDDFTFHQQQLDFSEFYTESSVSDEANNQQHVNIISPGSLVGTASMGMMLSVLWKWYAALPVGEEIIAAPLVAAAG